MQNIILLVHVVAGIIFILTVLAIDRGVGFGGAVGGTGGGGFYASQRGATKVVHKLSVFFCLIFFVTAIAYVLVPSPVSVDIPPSPSVEIPPAADLSGDPAAVAGDSIPAVEIVDIETEPVTE